MNYTEFAKALDTMYLSQIDDMVALLDSKKDSRAIGDIMLQKPRIIVRLKFKKTDEYKYLWNIPGFAYTDTRMVPMVDVNVRNDSVPITENLGVDGIVVFPYEQYDLVDDDGNPAKIVLPRQAKFVNYAIALDIIKELYAQFLASAVEKARIRAKWLR